jgi:hypothetical protein
VLAAILGVSGVVDLYLINRAVYWWRSIHPAVIVQREGGSGLGDPAMRLTLVLTMLAFFLLFLWLLRLRVRNAHLQGTVDDIRDILAAISKRHHVLGALGNGNRAKLAINLILGLNRAALAEGLVFAERVGLPLEPFLEVARGSAAYSQAMDVKGKIAQSHKDFSLILDAAHDTGQELPFAEVYRALMLGCIAHGDADSDNSAIIEEIRRRHAPAPAGQSDAV